MELRDYQWEAIAWLALHFPGLLHAPAGSGKTVIGANAVAVAIRHKVAENIVWIGNTIEQCQQARDALREAGALAGGDVRLRVCCSAANPDLRSADLVVFDECHHIPAQTWVALITQVKPTAIVWGLTATPDHENPFRNAVVNAAFPHRFTVDRERLVAAGHIVGGRVQMHDVDVPGAFDAEIEAFTVQETRRRVRRFPLVSPGEHYRRAKWQVTQEFIQENENRNSSIVSLAQSAADDGDSVLLLVHSIAHGSLLVARLSGASLVHSKVGARARGELVQGFRDGSLRILCSTSLADEGLDVPRASILVLAAGGRSGGRVEQRVGRILRPFEGKTGGTVHDFLDRASVFGYAQARARMKVYEKLGYHPGIVSYGNPPPKEEPESAQSDLGLTGTWDGFR